MEFLDEDSFSANVTEKSIFAFAKSPMFEVPDTYKSNWEKYQAIACQIWGRFTKYTKDLVSDIITLR